MIVITVLLLVVLGIELSSINALIKLHHDLDELRAVQNELAVDAWQSRTNDMHSKTTLALKDLQEVPKAKKKTKKPLKDLFTNTFNKKHNLSNEFNKAYTNTIFQIIEDLPDPLPEPEKPKKESKKKAIKSQGKKLKIQKKK